VKKICHEPVGGFIPGFDFIPKFSRKPDLGGKDRSHGVRIQGSGQQMQENTHSKKGRATFTAHPAQKTPTGDQTQPVGVFSGDFCGV
jgi:hypothetical protein